MKTKETYSLLRDAYQIIDGIPDENISFNRWVQEETLSPDKTPNCRTIACVTGWLAMHSKMNALGLTIRFYDDGFCTITSNGDDRYGNTFQYLADFFGISLDESRELFWPANSTDLRNFWVSKDTIHIRAFMKASNVTEKQIWLTRVRKFLAEKDGGVR